MRRTAAAMFICAGVLTSTIALAAEPPVNTGGTTFMDGFGHPRGWGFAYINYARLYMASSIKDSNGNDVPVFRDPRLTIFTDLNQFLYTFKTDGWFAHPGAYVLVPIVSMHSSFGAGGPALQDNGFGLGDTEIGAYLQFDPVMSEGRPVFVHRLNMAVIAPTGKYDSSKQINPGMHMVSLTPSWAATVLPLPRFEISTRLHYLYNFANNDPGGGLDSIRPGQAIHDNFAASYEILPFNPQRTAAWSLRAGLNGYYFKQITDTEVNGVKQPNSREQVLAVGPGVMWVATGDDCFFFNAYFETAVQNRFAGNLFQVRWAHAF